MDPFQQFSQNKNKEELNDMIKLERIREIQQTISFYKTAPLSQVINDAKRFDKDTIRQIELSAFNRVKEFNTLEEDEKKLFKWKIRKGVIVNLGLLGLYKIMSNPTVFNIPMKYCGRIVQFLTFKKGIFLWILSPAVAHYDYQEMVLRFGVKYYLIQQNKDILFNKDGSKVDLNREDF